VATVAAKKIEKIDGVFCTGFGCIICFLALRIRTGSFNDPGPGFMALFSGLVMVVVGIIMLFSLRSKAGRTVGQEPMAKTLDEEQHAISIRLRLTATVLLLFVYTFFLNIVGYLLCTLLLMWGLFYDWGKNRMFYAFLASLATTCLTYLVFEIWLRCQLPRICSTDSVLPFSL
jgi:hypothetical protein